MENAVDHYVQVIVDHVQSLAVIAPSQTIPLDESLLEAGILDSFGIVEMLTFIESEFDVTIPDEDITKEKLGSIRKMARYVHQQKGAACRL
jgi:acyl carrier protein